MDARWGRPPTEAASSSGEGDTGEPSGVWGVGAAGKKGGTGEAECGRGGGGEGEGDSVDEATLGAAEELAMAGVEAEVRQ